jgi:hypothetical protein
MEFVLDRQRISASKAIKLVVAALAALVLVTPMNILAQLTPDSQVIDPSGVESVAFRSKQSGRWIDQTTWQVYRSGVWIDADRVQAGVPDAGRNVFIETNHTIIATRAQLQSGGAVRDYNGNQAQAFVEVRDLHINTAASVTTTWGSVVGGFASRTVAAPTNELGTGTDAAGANNANAVGATRTIVTDWYDGDRFGGYVNPDLIVAGSSYQTLTAQQGGGQQVGLGNGFSTGNNALAQPFDDPNNTTPRGFDRAYWESIPPNNVGAGGAGQFGVGSVNSTVVRAFSGHPDPAVRAAGAAGLDPWTGGALTRPRNNELRVYGKLRYYAGAALDGTDRSAGIQVTAATIGTGSTIVFRGMSRVITMPNEWSTTLATTTGYMGSDYVTAGVAGVGDNSAFMIRARQILNTPPLAGTGNGRGNLDEIRNRFRGLMGRNSFWTAIFDLGRVRDRGFGSIAGNPTLANRDLYVNMNDYPNGAIGVLRGNFTAGIIQIRRGTVRFEGAALLANEGAATSGSIQVCNNAVLQIGTGGIGRTAVPVDSRPIAGIIPFNVNGAFSPVNLNTLGAQVQAGMNVAPDGYAPWGYQGGNFVASPIGPGGTPAAPNSPPTVTIGGVVVANPMIGQNSTPLPLTPRGPYVVTSRMRYFVVEEGGALEFYSVVGVEQNQNAQNPVLNPTLNQATLGASLSAADVRFNGTVIYSRTGDQNLVSDSPFLSHNPTGVVIDVASRIAYTPNIREYNTVGGAASVNIGENGLYDPYNNLRDPYNLGAYGVNVAGDVVAANVFGAAGAIAAIGYAGDGARPAAALPVAVSAGADPATMPGSPAAWGVGAAAVFAPATTAAYSHLTLRGSGNKYLIATTVTISRSLLMQGYARLQLNQTVSPILTQPTGPNSNLLAAVNNSWGVPTVGQGNYARKFGGYPPLVYLRSTGLHGFLEENNMGTNYRRTLRGAGAADANGRFPDTQGDFNEFTVMPMWSAYGGNTDPVAFVGFTTASTSIVPLDNDLSYPIGMVLSASTNREQIDMSPWHKPAVVHGLPAEPSYIAGSNARPQDGTFNIVIPANLGQGMPVHGWSFRGQQYGVQDLSSARFGQVIRQSLDRVNGNIVGFVAGVAEGVMNTPTPLALMGFANVAGGTVSVDNLIAHQHGGFRDLVPGFPYIGSRGNFPMITNSLYDYSINTTATTTLQYDSEQADVMGQLELPYGVIGPHNLVMNSPNAVTQTLPVRTTTLQRPLQALNINNDNTVAAPIIFGVTGGTIILGPEYTNSYNGNLPRQAFNPRYSGDVPYYQANAVYDACQAPGSNSDNGRVTAGVLASAYIDTRPDVADPAKVYAQGAGQTMYFDPSGLRPANALTGTFDGRVRVGFPRTFTQVGNMLPYQIAGNNSFLGSGPTLTHGVYNNRRVPTNAPSDFGRRGDYNNFGVVELRRGVLEIPSQTLESTASGFPNGRLPEGGAQTRQFNYTFVLSSTAIISREQENVTYRGEAVGPNNRQRVFVVLSDSPNGGDRGPVGAFNAQGVAGGSITGGAILRGPAGPANLMGQLKGGNGSIIITGGTSGTISPVAITNARNRNNGSAGAVGTNSTYGYEPPTYGALDNFNSGASEIPAQLGIPGFASVAPFTVTNTYNAGPEKYSDVDFTQFNAGGTVGRDEANTGSGRVTDNNAGAVTGIAAHSGTNIVGLTNAGGVALPGQVVRANNAYNIDLPYVVGGFNNLSFLRATANVITLVGNNDNRANTPDGVTSNNTPRAGLEIYGLLTLGRGDIDLNGRNIEMGGNLSQLVETHVRAQVVDSLRGRLLWSAAQQGLPRDVSGGNVVVRTSPTTVVTDGRNAIGSAFPVLPNTVINNNRAARAYIGLTSHRNVAFQNAAGGVTEAPEHVGGLGAMLYASGNPVQLRVRRWQTRGNGILGDGTRFNQGNVEVRGPETGIDRYWQIETTGTLNSTMTRSEIRLQYVDTDLNNDNGCLPEGLAPIALNIFRNSGHNFPGQIVTSPTQNYPNGGFDVNNVRFTQTWQALGARQNIGLDNFNFWKQLTLTGAQQVVAGVTVLNTSNFMQIPLNVALAGGTPGQNDPNNATPPSAFGDMRNSGFQMWAIGVTQPRCFVVRGQRFGGTFGDPIGGPGVDLPAIFSVFPTPGSSTALRSNGGGVPAATASLYGAYVGPFKAGVPTSATIVVEVLDDFGTVSKAPGFSARLSVRDTSSQNFQPIVAYGSATIPAPPGQPGAAIQTTGVNALNAGGRLEWTGLTVGGIASTNLTLTVVSVDSAGNDLPTTSNRFLPMCNAGVPVSLQGGVPFRLEFDQAANSRTGDVRAKVPGTVLGADGARIRGTAECPGGIVVGQDVTFGTDFVNNNVITTVVRDRFNNLASFPATVRLAIGGGTPIIDPINTALVNQERSSILGDPTGLSWGLGRLGLEVSPSSFPPQQAFYNNVAPGIPALFSQLSAPVQAARTPATSILFSDASLTNARPEIHHPQVNTHFVTFPNFRVVGTTSNNVTLVAQLNSDLGGVQNLGSPIPATIAGGNTTANVCLVAGPAIRLAPVPLVFVAGQPATRVPVTMFIGRRSPVFYVQAVDIFGNRDLTYTGTPGAGDRQATITFPASGLDPFNDAATRTNARPWTATGLTAQAVNGLYAFDNFVPGRPESQMLLDVLMQFRDPNLNGLPNQNPGFFPTLLNFRPQPSVTTASTTFNLVPTVGITTRSANGVASGTTLALRERAITFNGDTGNGQFQSGDVIIGFPAGFMSTSPIIPGIVSYSLLYTAANGSPLPDVAPNSIGLPVPLPTGARVGTASGMLPAPVQHFIVNRVGGADSTVGGFRDDLAPFTTVGATTIALTQQPQLTVGGAGAITLNATTPQQVFSFRGRFSDQRWDDPATTNVNERSAGIQGIRTATIRLFPDTVGTAYDIDPMAGVGRVTLDDPPRVRPQLENAIQDRQLQLTREEITELESPAFRTDNGRPSWVFYDDNYDPMFYSVEFDQAVISATITPNDTRPGFGGRPTLSYRSAPRATAGTRSTITVRAIDSRGDTAVDTFDVTLVDPRTGTTSVANVDASEMNLRVSPNPAVEQATVSAVAKVNGTVTINVVNTLGVKVATFTQPIFAGQAYSQIVDLKNFAAGAYTITVNDGTSMSATKVIKQ